MAQLGSRGSRSGLLPPRMRHALDCALTLRFNGQQKSGTTVDGTLAFVLRAASSHRLPGERDKPETWGRAPLRPVPATDLPPQQQLTSVTALAGQRTLASPRRLCRPPTGPRSWNRPRAATTGRTTTGRTSACWLVVRSSDHVGADAALAGCSLRTRSFTSTRPWSASVATPTPPLRQGTRRSGEAEARACLYRGMAALLEEQSRSGRIARRELYRRCTVREIVIDVSARVAYAVVKQS